MATKAPTLSDMTLEWLYDCGDVAFSFFPHSARADEYLARAFKKCGNRNLTATDAKAIMEGALEARLTVAVRRA